MPTKYRIKKYLTGGIYHIYNKGIEGRDIFRSDDDYIKLEEILAHYLTRNDMSIKPGFKPDKPSVAEYKRRMNLTGEVVLIAYCLMPNHYHLLVKQNSPDGIVKLMRRVMTAYVMYYNRKYKRSGPLLENIYRAVLVDSENDALELTRIIHLNPVNRVVRRFGPVEAVSGSRPEDYRFSSYSSYLGIYERDWVNPMFSGLQPSEYRKMVESGKNEADGRVTELMIDGPGAAK